MINKIGYIAVLAAAFASAAFAQKPVTTVGGFVYDKSTGETLIGATVQLSGGGIRTGAFTNTNGYFVITNAPEGRDSFQVSYAGYESKDTVVEVGSKPPRLLNVYLTQSSYKVGEVVVTGNSVSAAQKAFDRPVSTVDMTSQQINAIPKLGVPDLFRALQSLPGIVSLSDFSSAIYIRGGTPSQNLYLIDGAEIYDPEHAFGIFSTFNTDAIKQVKVSEGGFGPQYDDRLSGVIDVIDKDGNRNNIQGTLDASLIAANLTLSAPLGSLGSISGSFRRTYINQTLGWLSSNIPPYYFFDGNLKAFLRLDDKDVLTLSYFGSGDNLNFQTQEGNPQSPSILLTWGNTLGSINWKHLFSDKLFSSFYLTYSGFFSDFSSTNGASNMAETNPLSDYTARDALTYYAYDELTLEAGVEYKRVDISYNRNATSGLIDLGSPSHEASGYINAEWEPDPLWQIDAGLRIEQFKSDTAYSHVDPRFSVKYRLTDESSLKFATGIYHQYMEAVERPFAPDVWLSADRNIYDSQSDQFILGYEQEIAGYLDLDVQTYYSTFRNIYQYNYNVGAETSPSYYNPSGTPVYTSSQDVFTRGDGKAYGLEILLKKDAGPVTGWVGYTWSNTLNTFDGVNQGNSFVPQQERTSVVNLSLTGDVGNIFGGNWNESQPKSSSSWILGVNFIYTSGQPITLPSSAYFVNTLPAWGDYGATGKKLPSYQLYPGEIDSYRLPPYVRLDLSITWHKDCGTWSLAPYLQIFNATDRKNVWYINYSTTAQDGTITQDITRVNQLPFLPSLGVTVNF